MPIFELLTRSALYLASGYALALVSWIAAHRSLPRHARPGFRLALVILGQFMLTAVVVQWLGLAGLLRPGPYLAATLIPGLAAGWLYRAHRPHRSLLRLCGRTASLWLTRAPFGLGFLGGAMLIFLAWHAALVDGIDSLSYYGPLAVDWVQRGEVTLLSHWNYPQCWEYQFVPGFLLLSSDIMALAPRLLAVLALMLVIRELGAALGLPARLALPAACLPCLGPLLWGDGAGIKALKNDTAFALGMLICLLATFRAWRGRRGTTWPFLLGAFLVAGTKATGFAYSGALFAVFLLPTLRRAPRKAALLTVLCLLVLATPLSTQAVNLWVNQNPVHPVHFSLGPLTLFEGRLDLSGTSILDHLDYPDLWLHLLRAGIRRIGIEFPLALALFAAAACHSLANLATPGRIGPVAPRRPRWLFPMLAVLVPLLWVLYFGAPLSSGHRPPLDTQFIRGGGTLRYAIAPICLTWLAGLSWLHHRLGRWAVPGILGLTFPLLLAFTWRAPLSTPGASTSWHTLLGHLLLTTLLLAGTWYSGRALLRRLPALVRHPWRTAVPVLIVAVLLFTPAWAILVEQRRDHGWSPDHREIWTHVRKKVAPGSVIACNHHRPLWRYLLYGPRLNNRLVHLPLDDKGFHKQLELSDARHYYLFFRSIDRSKRKALLEQFNRLGWREVAHQQRGAGILLVRQ